MNEQQYLDICQACDSVLLEASSNNERVATHWLHVIREHPAFLNAYEDLVLTRPVYKSVFLRCLRILRNAVSLCLILWKGLRTSNYYWCSSGHLPKCADIVIVSHIVNVSHAGKNNDFYFGELPDRLARSGKSVIVVIINHTDSDGAILAASWRKSAVPRVVLGHNVGFGEELILRRKLKKESWKLFQLARRERRGLIRAVYKRAALEVLSGASIGNLRRSFQIGALLNNCKAKSIMVTYEGHVWERLTFSVARETSPGIRCHGYAHGAIFRLQHAIRRNRSKKYNPDHIFTSGSVAKDQLRAVDALRDIGISVLGSARKLQIKPEVLSGIIDSAERPACLVIPDGLITECRVMFAFSLECARSMPEIDFIWRVHPAIDFKTVFSGVKMFRTLPPNIYLSSNDVDSDIYKSKWALYRGSTLIIQAVANGLRPIYLSLQNELTLDPLYELKNGKAIVTDVQDFQQVVVADLEKVQDEIFVELANLKNYAESFYMPLDYKQLI